MFPADYHIPLPSSYLICEWGKLYLSSCSTWTIRSCDSYIVICNCSKTLPYPERLLYTHLHCAGGAAHQVGSVCFGRGCCAFNRQFAQALRYSAFSQWCGPSLHRSGPLGSLVWMAEENNYNITVYLKLIQHSIVEGSVCERCLPVFKFGVCSVFLPAKKRKFFSKLRADQKGCRIHWMPKQRVESPCLCL